MNIKKVTKDLVFIFTIFGNDFLPKCEAIQTNYDFLKFKLLENFKDISKKKLK